MEPIGRCRVCGSEALTLLYSLGDLFVSNFVAPGLEYAGPKYPLEMELCRVCGLVQLRHTAPQELLYSRHYWYRSGVTDSMRRSLRHVVLDCLWLIPLETGDTWLDIGSNDGTLLREVPSNLRRVGVEPADNLQEEGRRGINCLIHDFWNAEAYWKQNRFRPRVVTALGMFYDLDNPNQFIRDIAEVLHPDGIFVAQLMCLAQMIYSRDIGNICHEHLEYYSLHSLGELYEQNGLEIIDLTENDVNGGSFRIYARKKGSPVQPRPGAMQRLWEFRQREEEFTNPEFHRAWFENLRLNRGRCVKFICDAIQYEKKRVWVYGASTKGNTILQWYNLDRNLIEGAADRSPEKWGTVTVGTGIPIYSEQHARDANPDYFLVLPYAFLNEFLAREQQWRSNGGKFLVPIPDFRVV